MLVLTVATAHAARVIPGPRESRSPESAVTDNPGQPQSKVA